MQPILIVDDDRLLVDVVSFLLRRGGLDSTAAFDAPSAIKIFEEQQPELVILDVHLGETDGRDLLRRFRRRRPETLILMLTAVSAEDDRVLGLELGADDYLTKPFGHREFVARVRALLRRRSAKTHTVVVPPRPLQQGRVVLNPATHEVTNAGRRLDLSPTEFRLLHTLMSRPNVLVPTRALLKEVWGHQDLTARNVLRVTTSRLRAKLEDDPGQPRMLCTVPGEGLIFQPTPARERAAEPSPTAEADSPLALDVIADLQLLGGDRGMQPLRDLHDAYVKMAAQHVDSMHTALLNGDADALAEDAHRLGGSSGSMGAQRAMRVCGSIMERARAGDLAQVDVLLDELERELAAYDTAIQPMLEVPC